MCLALALGCAQSPAPRRLGDPMLGSSPTAPLSHHPVSVPAGSGTASAPAVPGFPTSNAALASGMTRPLSTGGDARIAPPAPGTAPGWQGVQPASPPSVSSPAAPVNGSPLPQPVPAQPPAAVLARGVAPTAAQVATYEQAQAILTARGVRWQRLETWGDKGEWKFTCSIPNPQNQFISRTYEARASNDLTAIRAVLEQMERER
ncbi:MAG: hypothetical protein ACK4RK_15690 [Gemmataceae bacterium]